MSVFLKGYVASVSSLIILGNILSWLNLLGSKFAWGVGLGILTIIASFVSSRKLLETFSDLRIYGKTVFGEWKASHPVERWMVFFLGGAAFCTAIFSLVGLLLIAPRNADALSYHLPRMAYYIQHGNTNFFDSNYWAQVVHPHNSTLLMIPFFLFLGNNACQLPQWFAYLAAVIAIGCMCRWMGASRIRCLEVSLFAALVPSWVMESCTAQNDMLMAALTACAVVFILENSLWFAMASLCVMLGLKASALLPAVVIGMVFVMRVPIRNYAAALGVGAVCFAILTLPSGYITTAKHFGHPFGPEDVRRSHAFSNYQDPLRYGLVNLARYGVDFCSLDGLPPVWPVTSVQKVLRHGVQFVVKTAGIDLLSAPSRPPNSFSFEKDLGISEDGCFWGVLGFALLWPLVFAGFFFKKYRPWSACSLIFLILQAVSSPYDPWRGRYFITGAVFALPLLLLALDGKSAWIRWYLLIASAVVGLSGGGSICLSRWPISFTWGGEVFESLFLRDRLGQMEGGAHRLEKEFRAYERLVPPGSTVGLATAAMREYSFFGEHLNRIIVPLPKGKPYPSNIDYLVLDDQHCTQSSDICLGQLWLRKMTK